MSLLLDTHALHWMSTGNSRLSARALAAIRAEPDVHVSAISALELALQQRLGKIRFPLPMPDWWQVILSQHNVQEIPVSGDIAARAPSVPLAHKDQFDRVIVATAMRHGLTVVTCDREISKCSAVDVVW